MDQWEKDFKEWYDAQDWWHDPVMQLGYVWFKLHRSGLSKSDIIEVFNDIVSVMRNEYGD